MSLASLKRGLHRMAARLAATILRPGAAYDPETFRFWERRGLHVLPNHFYFPVPDTRELAASYRERSAMPGIDLRPEAQRAFLREICGPYREELAALPVRAEPGNGEPRFQLDNDAFTGIDPHLLWSILRWLRPANVIEIGSGHSTLLGAQALRTNGAGRWRSIDPTPRDFILSGVPGVELIRRRVERSDLALFDELRAGDVLFIDSSHVVRTGGDVVFLILEVLPRLAPGVVVHLHDILLPFDYPREWLTEKLLFWSEQYLLQAYLAENEKVEILIASHFAAQTCPEDLHAIFPQALRCDGGSFWLRKK